MHPSHQKTALIDADAVRTVDRRYIEAGGLLSELVEQAGGQVADAVRSSVPNGSRIAFLIGPGLNGADAKAAARLLADEYAVALYGPEAAKGMREYGGIEVAVRPCEDFAPEGYDGIVDGLFGVGLSRPLEGPIGEMVRRTNQSSAIVVSIDLPSGIDSVSGAVRGVAVRADVTVTFDRRKPGHLLMPGRSLCGNLIVAELGMPSGAFQDITPVAYANELEFWIDELRQPGMSGHKYDRGHAVIFSGPAAKSGAARLSAMGALRAGAGLVTIAGRTDDLNVLAAQTTAIMLMGCDRMADVEAMTADERLNAFVIGPGFSNMESARSYVTHLVRSDRRVVIDADAITAFAGAPDELFEICRSHPSQIVLTPHGGEFRRLFADIAQDESSSKIAKARAAAERSSAVVVFKGADSVIAAPDGRVAVNATGTPWLATAGTGDVLAGIIAAQIAQGVPSFEAACIGVWMHGRAAEFFGPGLISEDLPNMLPQVHAALAERIRNRHPR